MSQTAGPSSRGDASTSAVGSSSNLPRSAAEATECPNCEEATAIVKLHSFFHLGGTAYTLNNKAVSRYYCKACLEHEVGVVRAAREQYGQGTNATDDVLRNIAMGRMEYYTPNQQILKEHLKGCKYLSKGERKRFNNVKELLSELKGKKVKHNPYDFGSLYEVVQYPKYATGEQDISPGAASPAQIFAMHEQTLARRAKKRLKDALNNAKQKKRKAEAAEGSKQQSLEGGSDQQPDVNDADESDDFEEAQRVNWGNASLPRKAKVDTNMVFEPDPEANEPELPPDFPSSDLLKALQTHAGTLYEERGLMSTDAHPKTEAGQKLPSMIQSLDASALIALGILTQELARASVVRPHHPQPLSDFYERKIEKKSITGAYRIRSRKEKRVVSKLLQHLPEGSAASLARRSQSADANANEVIEQVLSSNEEAAEQQ